VRFRLNKINWRPLRRNDKLAYNVGLAVVLILFFALFSEILISAIRFRSFLGENLTVEQKQAVKHGKAFKIRVHFFKRAPARVAIILDDAGGDIPDYKAICSIKEPLTISVLPDMPGSERTAKAMSDAGFEVMLHLPMESVNGNYRRSGGGMVNTSSSDQEIKKIVLEDLSSVKWVAGVNNHMGSKATSDERVMKDVLSVLKGTGLYFIDSRTSEKSVAFRSARDMHIHTAENNVFLDGETEPAYVADRLKRLVMMARKRGCAVGIGHATRPATIAALKELMPKYKKDGIEFVYASELVK